MKATEQYFPVVRSIMLFTVVLIVESEDETYVWQFTRKLLKQFFPVVMLFMLYKAVLPFEMMKSYGVTTQMKATEQYVSMVLLFLSLWEKSYSVTTQLKLNLSTIIFTGYLTSQHFTFQNLLPYFPWVLKQCNLMWKV